MKIFELIDSALNRAEGLLLVLMLSVMVLLSFAQVVLRNVVGEGLVWADILLRHLVLWVGFLGASLAVSQQRHIGIDVLARALSGRWKLAARLVTNVFAAVICFILLDASRTFLAYEIEDSRTLIFGIPEWYSQLILPVGFALLMIHFLVRVAASSRNLIRGSSE